MAPAPSALRSWDTRLWITLTLLRGGWCLQRASVSRSMLTSSPAHAISTERAARSLGPVMRRGPVGPVTASGPRTANRVVEGVRSVGTLVHQRTSAHADFAVQHRGPQATQGVLT